MVSWPTDYAGTEKKTDPTKKYRCWKTKLDICDVPIPDLYVCEHECDLVAEKRTWPEFFQRMLDGKKNCDIRLADFQLREGMVLVFREWEPSQGGYYTGRTLVRRVKNLMKVKFGRFHSRRDLEQYGQYIIELEEAE